jgi:putative transposase
MARHWFAKGTTFVWTREGRGEAFLIRQSLLGGQLLLENQTSGGEERTPLAELIAAWGAGALVFSLGKRNTRRRDPALPPTEYTFGDFGSLPAAVRDEAWRRYSLIRPYLAMSRRERGDALQQLKKARSAAFRAVREQGLAGETARGEQRLQPPRAKIGEGDSPSARKRWLRDFTASGYDIRALVPLAEGQPGGRGKQRLAPEVEAVVAAVIDEGKLRVAGGAAPAVSLNDLTAAARVRVAALNRERGDDEALRPPSRDVIGARLVAAQLDHLLARQRSPLESHKEGVQTRVGSRPTRVYERVEIDHSPIDLIVVDDVDRLPIGRPEATYAVDGYSRYPAGLYLSFAPVSTQAVISCLAQCILPEMPGQDIRTLYKTEHGRQSYGMIETVFLDNERCNVGNSVREACGQLGIHFEQQPLGQPWFKATIERYIRTHHKDLLHHLPGTTFSDIVRRGDYDPMAMACISYSAFKAIMHVWLYDIYAARKHAGLGNRIPARVLEEGLLRYPPVLDHSAEHVRLTLLDTERRDVHHYGIDINGLRYQGPALASLRARLRYAKDKEVKVNFHREDLGQIHVLDEFEGRWLTIPANPDFAAYARGLSLWKHHLIVKFAKKTNPTPDLDALARARVKLQRIVAEEFALKGGKVTRKNQARYLGIGVESPAMPAGDVIGGVAGIEVPVLPPAAGTSVPAVLADDGVAMVLASLTDDPEPVAAPTTRRAGGKPRRTPPVLAEEEPDELPDRAEWGGTVRGPQRPVGAATTAEDPDRAGWGGGVRGPVRPRVPTPATVEPAPVCLPDPPKATEMPAPEAVPEEPPDRTDWRASTHLPRVARRRRLREEG